MGKKKDDRAALAALLGIDAPISDPFESADDISREAEATLAYAADSSAFIRKSCKICNRTFAHTRGAVAYCSNRCRSEGLEQIGIKWNWTRKAEDRWSPFQDEPLVVPPEALSILTEQEEATPAGNASLNALIEQVYAPVIEETQRREQKLLDLFAEFGIE